MRFASILTLLLGLVGWFSLGADGFAAELLAKMDVARERLSTDSIRQHVETLASDAFEGREAGEPGGRSTASYLMSTLRELGLQPAGLDGTYFQEFSQGYRNVIARVPGSNPGLQDQVILVTAHFDHVGYGNEKTSNGPVGQIHNGADDNASGVAALLELAKMLQMVAHDLGRTVVIIFWDAEEKGLWGSKHWLANPTFPTGQVRLMINVDMVGRLRQGRLSLIGTRSMEGLRSAWSRANSTASLQLEFPWNVFDNSDHFPFFLRQIPVTMLHTGLHDDYHTPNDDTDKVNFEGIHACTELLFQFVCFVANARELPPFRVASLRESTPQQQHFERPAVVRDSRLGVVLGDEARDGVAIDGVDSDSPAATLGLRPGDVLTRINGEPATLRAVAAILATATTPVRIRVKGREKSIDDEYEITLRDEPVRVGLSWRDDLAEPFTVLVSGVIPGTPADLAGFERLDHIHAVGATRLGPGKLLKDILLGITKTTEVLVERQGRMLYLQLDLSKERSTE